MFRRSGIVLRLTVALALLAGALALTGCFGGGGGISIYGSIDGYVYYHANARGTGDSEAAKPEMIVTRSSKAPSGYLPLQGARVVAVQASKITYSNSQGYFILTSLSPGVYDVSITHERFINGLTYPGVQVVAGWTTHLGDAKLGSFFYLIIGINDYPEYPSQPTHDLQYAVADAELLEATLWGANGYAGEVVRLTDANAKKADIFSAIREIGAKMSPNGQDYFVMTFSGHGGYQQDPNPNPEPPGDDPQEFLVASDDLVITDDELTTWIRNYIPTNFCLFVFDSCHSGGMVKGGPLPASAPAWMKNFRPGLSGLARDLNKYGYVVLMASDDDESSLEDPQLGHGVFTYYLCEGISTGQANTNGDAFVSSKEAYDYAKPLVMAFVASKYGLVQTPQLYADPPERANIPIYRVQ